MTSIGWVSLNFLMLLVGAVLLLSGCKIPLGDVTSVTTSVVGLSVGYNAASQMPELRVGLFRQTLHFVPTNSPSVTSSLSLEQHGLTANIFEEFTTGGATIPSNSIARMRAARVQPAKNPIRMPIRNYRAPKDSIGVPPMPTATSSTNTDSILPPPPR